jgi:hypothetical protein
MVLAYRQNRLGRIECNLIRMLRVQIRVNIVKKGDRVGMKSDDNCLI